MDKSLTVEKSIDINVSPEKVWEAIVDPELVKQYFFGTEILSGWEPGSDIIFQGTWEGQTYRDKGKILEIKKGSLLRYSYWSAFSGLEDRPENYSEVTYRISDNSGFARIDLKQKGFTGKEACEHAEAGWDVVLEGMKKLLESLSDLY